MAQMRPRSAGDRPTAAARAGPGGPSWPAAGRLSAVADCVHDLLVVVAFSMLFAYALTGSYGGPSP